MTDSTRHPTALWFIFWGEFAERCSYYGMRAILPLYLATVLHFPDNSPVYYWFKMAVYFLPLFGGFLADRFIGRYWAIVGFSVPYVLGHFILGIESRVALVVALTLLALGSGVTKPNISTLLGMTYDQQRPGNEKLLSSAFRWFYFSINFGAFLSQAILPTLRDNYGYAVAFQFPAWLMVGALLAFAAGKRFYAVETPGKQVMSADERQQQWQTLGTLAGVFSLVIFFWVAYEHNDGLWVYFIRDHADRTIPWIGRTVAPDQIQALNPLFVMIIVPALTWFIHIVDRDQRLFTAANRILLGFLATVCATGLMSAAGFWAQGGAKVPIAWIALAYITLTLGEVLVYSTGLELSYTLAPKNMKGFITACFLVTMTLGNLINTVWVPFYPPGPLSPGVFFGLTALLVLAAAIVFYFVGQRLTRAQKVAADLASQA